MNLEPLDQAILIVYMIGIVLLGLFLRRRAAGSVEEYFLAGRRLHWLVISMSGSVTTYDITGTLWIV
ncbi:MAG: sodium:solute symporter, partial [bacterium]